MRVTRVEHRMILTNVNVEIRFFHGVYRISAWSPTAVHVTGVQVFVRLRVYIDWLRSFVTTTRWRANDAQLTSVVRAPGEGGQVVEWCGEPVHRVTFHDGRCVDVTFADVQAAFNELFAVVGKVDLWLFVGP